MQEISPIFKEFEQQLYTKNSTKKVDLCTQPDTFESNTKKENKNKKIAKICLIGAAITASVVGMIYAIKKGKTINLKDMTPNKFKQIQTDKFTGKIKGKLKNGDKVVMEYVDGVLNKSTRSGKVNFEKTYKTINNNKIVKKTVGDVTTEFNITKTQQEVKSAQEKLKNILKDDTLFSDELMKQADDIKFKSQNQKKEIKNKINSKIKSETEAQAKARQEAEKKKQELEQIAKQKAEKEAQDKIIREAEKLKQQQILEAKTKFEKGITDFKASLYNKTDEEINHAFQDTLTERNDIWNKAYKIANEKGIKSSRACDILENLSEAEKQEYKLLETKLDVIMKEQNNRRYNYIDKILHKAGDKPINTTHCSKYGTTEELTQLHNYYDCYTCNDAYRGQGGAINVKEDLMDSLFKKAPALEEDAIVYRSVHASLPKYQNFIDSIKDNCVIENPAYTSTATKIKDAQFYQFAGIVTSKEVDGVLMRIKVPKGTKGILGGHNEYLLPRNSKIKVNKVSLTDGIKIADCEYILPM